MVEGAMRNNTLVFFFLAVIVIFGFIALPKLKKNEFPDVTIRSGVVAVVYPGATADEIEERVAGKVEQFLFTFSDVDKTRTFSYSYDGMLLVLVNLVNETNDTQMTWSRIRQSLVLFRTTDLPQGVVATAVIDDFGNASSLLLAIESDQRSSRELRAYADKLAEKLRFIKYGVNDMEDEFGQILQAIIDLLNDPEIGGNVPDHIEFMKKGLSIGATAIQPVYAGSRVRTGNKLAKLGIEAAELQTQISERDMLEEIESTYYLVLGLQQKVGTLESALGLIDSLDKVVKVAMDAGLVTKSDALRVALKRNEFLAMQMRLNNGIVLASQLLCQQIGIEYPEEGLNLENDLENHDRFVSNDYYIRPELTLLQLQVDAERMYKKMDRGEALPMIGLGLAANYGMLIQKKFKANAVLFATIQIPISSWWETKHKINERNFRIKEVELMQQDLTEKMGLQEKQAYNTMVEAEALLESDRAALDMAQENYRLAELNYKAGLNTLTDVLESNTLLLQAQNAITDREITYATARRRYYDLTGK